MAPQTQPSSSSSRQFTNQIRSLFYSFLSFLAHLGAEISSFEVLEVRDADDETHCFSNPETSNARILVPRRARKLVFGPKWRILFVCLEILKLKKSKISIFSIPSSQKSPENRQESTMEKVYRYTRDLALSRDKKVVKRAFERLLQLDCSSQIFKNAKTLKTAIKYPGSTPCFNREIHLLKLKIEKLEKRDQQLNAMEYDPFNPAGMSNFNRQEMDKLMAKFPIYIPTQIGQKINKSSEQEEEEYDPFFAIFEIPNDSRKMEILDLFAIYTPTPI